MITRTIPPWHQSLIEAFREPKELAEYLQLDSDHIVDLDNSDTGFAMLVPRGFASRMEKRNPRDPLLLQVIPRGEELQSTAGFTQDPVGDSEATIVPGLLHKYHGRALLITTGACSIHCRYCFRRHFPYSESNACGSLLEPALDHIRSSSDITEIILSGGDPLMQSDSYLEELIRILEQIPHLQRLRIHSRMPITLPERMTPDLLNILSQSRLQSILVLHCNHANELDERVTNVISALHKSGLTMLNQSVLLRDINDSLEIQSALCSKLFANSVLPYYLHQLDRVDGAMHFEVRKEAALTLYKRLQERLPGYMVPKLVFEKRGAKSKIQLCPD